MSATSLSTRRFRGRIAFVAAAVPERNAEGMNFSSSGSTGDGGTLREEWGDSEDIAGIGEIADEEEEEEEEDDEEDEDDEEEEEEDEDELVAFSVGDGAIGDAYEAGSFSSSSSAFLPPPRRPTSAFASIALKILFASITS